MRSKEKLIKFICIECNALVDDVYQHYGQFHPYIKIFSCYLCRNLTRDRDVGSTRGINKFANIKCLVRHHKKFHQNSTQNKIPKTRTYSQEEIPSSQESSQAESSQAESSQGESLQGLSQPCSSGYQSSQNKDIDEMDDEMHIDTVLPVPVALSSVTEAAGTFICGLLNEPSLPAVQVFSVANMVTDMYGPLINYLRHGVLPNIDPKFKTGNYLLL